LQLWDLAANKEVARWKEAGLVAETFSPDGKRIFLLTNKDNGNRLQLEVLTTKGDKEPKRFLSDLVPIEGGDSFTQFAVFSSDASRVLTVHKNHKIKCWDVPSLKQVQEFEGFPDGLKAVAVAPDGKQILTGGTDGRSRLWDVASGKEVHVFEGHSGWMRCVAFAADGKHAATGGADHTVRIWDTSTGRELCRLFDFFEEGWAVVDVAGRYDASKCG
jgi:WD40 repeat protein